MSVDAPAEHPEKWANIGYKLSPKAFYGFRYMGSAPDPDVEVVHNFLQEDRVQAALDFLLKMGLGAKGGMLAHQNLIAAECVTRTQGEKIDLSPLLAIEYIPEEQSGHLKELGDLANEIVARQSERFGWRGEAKILITILPKEFDAPWATSKYGYCAPREPYYKIGIPFHAAAPKPFMRVFTHEFAHVISESESNQKIPVWVGEGFSVFASNDFDPGARETFLKSRSQWLDTLDLGVQFSPTVDLGTREKWLAYQQAGWIVRYLASLEGEKELLRFFEQFAGESFWTNLEADILGRSKTAEALHDIYRLKERDAFSGGYETVCMEAC